MAFRASWIGPAKGSVPLALSLQARFRALSTIRTARCSPLVLNVEKSRILLSESTRSFRRCNIHRSLMALNDDSQKKKVIFLGTPEVAASSLRRLFQKSQDPASDYEVVAVVSNPPAPSGRKMVLTASPVHAAAEDLGLPVFTPSGIMKKYPDSAAFLDTLRELAPDLCITAAYGQFLTKSFLDIPRYGTLNIHPSLLPKFRGAAPVPRSLEAGVKVTGVSVLFTALKMDSGPILAQETMELTGDEKADGLLPVLFDKGSDLLVSSLGRVWSGEARQDGHGCTLQDENEATEAAKMSKDEGRLWFTENAVYMHNKVRAFAGWPGHSTLAKAAPFPFSLAPPS